MDATKKEQTRGLMRKLGSTDLAAKLSVNPEDLTPEEKDELQAMKDDDDRAKERENTRSFSKKLLSKLPNPFAKEQ